MNELLGIFHGVYNGVESGSDTETGADLTLDGGGGT